MTTDHDIIETVSTPDKTPRRYPAPPHYNRYVATEYDRNAAEHTALDIEQMATDFEHGFPMNSLRDLDAQIFAQSRFFARAFQTFADKADAPDTATPEMDDYRLAALMSDRFRALYRIINNTHFRREMVDLAQTRLGIEEDKINGRG